MGYQAGATSLLDNQQQFERIETTRLLKTVLGKPGHATKPHSISTTKPQSSFLSMMEYSPGNSRSPSLLTWPT
jgi:hypothetical protein